METRTLREAGIQGLYGGLTEVEIKDRKGIQDNESLFNRMGSTELAANLFHFTQTDEKLCRDKMKDKSNENRTHYEVGAKVRQTIQELGGTMPEDLPIPEKSIKQIEKQEKN